MHSNPTLQIFDFEAGLENCLPQGRTKGLDYVAASIEISTKQFENYLIERTACANAGIEMSFHLFSQELNPVFEQKLVMLKRDNFDLDVASNR